MERWILAMGLFFGFTIVFGQKTLPVSDGEVVQHRYYSLGYSEANEQAEWVCYTNTNMK